MNSVAVIDYGMGNLHSVAKALEHVAENTRVIVSSVPEHILAADRVVLPGVGAIRDCIAELKRLHLHEVIKEAAQQKPLLGVCVGLQALMDFSEENDGTQCLGILSGNVKAFDAQLKDPITNERLKVPHMGWNQVNQVIKHPLWQDIPQDARFYFVHSYYVQPNSPEPIAASTSYGFPFASAVTQDNVFAVQFHPEKSQHVGLTLYKNFLNWNV
ncbi:imidazole glycerol phosphate synthase subunit HisH [Kaarinaea lacus]